MRAPRGWLIVGWVALAVGAMTAIILALAGSGENGLRLVVRATARSSVLLFLLAFTAGPLARAWPSAPTRWQRANRRYLGVSFAVSHGVHLLALLTLADWSLANVVARAGVVTALLGGLGYLFVAAMTATSFDRSAAWLGAVRWRWLHTVGAHYLWLVFFLTYVPLAFRSVFYWPLAVLLVLTVFLRIRYPARAPAHAG